MYYIFLVTQHHYANVGVGQIKMDQDCVVNVAPKYSSVLFHSLLCMIIIRINTVLY